MLVYHSVHPPYQIQPTGLTVNSETFDVEVEGNTSGTAINCQKFCWHLKALMFIYRKILCLRAKKPNLDYFPAGFGRRVEVGPWTNTAKKHFKIELLLSSSSSSATALNIPQQNRPLNQRQLPTQQWYRIHHRYAPPQHLKTQVCLTKFTRNDGFLLAELKLKGGSWGESWGEAPYPTLFCWSFGVR